MKNLRRAPLTIAAVSVLWLLGALSGSLAHGPSTSLLALIGTGLGPLRAGHWWSPLTAMLWSSGLAAYLVDTVLLLALLPMVEHRLGSWRAFGLLPLTQVVGVGVGLGMVELIGLSGGRWADQLAVAIEASPSGAVLAGALAVSAGMSALWRRRLRLVLLVGLGMLALYSGLLSDIVRLCSGVAGLGLGALLLRRSHHRLGGAPSRPETRILVALVVAASAVGPLIAAWAQTRVGPLSVLRFVFASPPADPLAVQQICADPSASAECLELQTRLRLSGIGPALMSVMPVMLLLITAEGLRRGRRAAWWTCGALSLGLAGLGVMLAVNAAVTPADERVVLGSGRHLHAWLTIALPALQPVLVVGLLLIARRQFDVRAPAGTYWRWARLVLGTLLAVSVVDIGGSLLVADGYDRPPGLAELLTDLPLRFLPPGYLGEVEPAFLPVSWPATLLFEWTGLVFWAVVAIAGLVTFTRTHLDSVPAELARVRELLAVDGGSSLAHMASWRGHAYWFTRDSRAAVAFRVLAGVAITTGGPIGAPDQRPEAVCGFSEYCRLHGWTPCWYSVDEEVAKLVDGLGFSLLQVAEETVVPLTDLSFTGRKWQDVRTALNRAERAGILAEWCRYGHAPRAITEQIRVISEEWVAEKGLPEMGFTLGGLDELADDAVRLLIAVDRDRTVHGVTSWLPVRRDGRVVGWTLDFMRRRLGSANGVMEFLIATAALRCQEEGAEFLSLSGAPLARLDRDQPIGPSQRLLDWAGRLLEPVYGFRSLMAFKAKFQPDYRPLYIGYPDPSALPGIGNALRRAYLPRLSARQATRLARMMLGQPPAGG